MIRPGNRVLHPWLLLSPAVASLSVLLVIPVLFIVVYSFWLRTASGQVVPQFTLDNWRELFGDIYYWEILGRTLRLSVTTTLACALLGYPVAYFLAYTRMRLRFLLALLLMLPFWISFVIRTMSWIHVLGTNGFINRLLLQLGLIDEPFKLLYNDISIHLGLMHVLLPFMILNIYVSLDGMDRNLASAARTLGAGAWRAFRDITFPLSLPGLAAGCLLCFVMTSGTYVTPLLLGGPGNAMFASLIYDAIIRQFDWPFGAVLSLLLLALLATVVLIYNRFLGMSQVFRSFGR
ncbi:MAG: spermidine/putrescine transport system permease protein [Rhodospirillaceae bacterium]|jgi:spermidine/putrescine transport system permease protein|nr:spermidine/putrescine transport system permease protein [Rhodospirillaceae bacterium]